MTHKVDAEIVDECPFCDDPEESLNWHVYPTFGKQHEAATTCWCNPDLHFFNSFTGDSVYVHNMQH